MSGKIRPQKVVSITLEEKFLLIQEIVADLRDRKRRRRVFVEKDPSLRMSVFSILDKVPDLHPGVAPLIADLMHLIHHRRIIVTDEDLDILLREAGTYAKKLKLIHDKVVQRVTSRHHDPKVQRQIHQQAFQHACRVGLVHHPRHGTMNGMTYLFMHRPSNISVPCRR